MQLLRPAAWIKQNDLTVGRTLTPQFNDIAIDGVATVTAVKPCPAVSPGSGSVVTGRFVTRRAGNLLEVTLESGTRFTGTTTHPVWLPGEDRWVPLGELRPGQQVETLAGPVAVASIDTPRQVSDVYTIEVHGHHVYRITDDGVLVHNVCLDNLSSFKFRGARSIDSLQDASHADIVDAFRHTQFMPSEHFITRLKEFRTRSRGFKSFGDLEALFRHGNISDAKYGRISLGYNGLEIVIDPSTGRLITIIP